MESKNSNDSKWQRVRFRDNGLFSVLKYALFIENEILPNIQPFRLKKESFFERWHVWEMQVVILRCCRYEKKWYWLKITVKYLVMTQGVVWDKKYICLLSTEYRTIVLAFRTKSSHKIKEMPRG